MNVTFNMADAFVVGLVTLDKRAAEKFERPGLEGYVVESAKTISTEGVLRIVLRSDFRDPGSRRTVDLDWHGRAGKLVETWINGMCLVIQWVTE